MVVEVRNGGSGPWKKLKTKFDSLTPQEIAFLCIRLLAYILRPLGVHVLTDCHTLWLSNVAYFVIMQHSVLFIYTVQYYWKDNKLSSMQPIPALGVSITVCFNCSLISCYFEQVAALNL